MEIFKSRRFWSALVGILAMVVSSLVPALAEHINVIVPGILGIIGLVIGGYSAEDFAARKANAPATYGKYAAPKG